ncbi:50S ribosomal protein L22 [Candidatus Shapirobacteria bacterium]|nr:50S ribosomal protein L22 [Candidatus Shapirobacteria bacterium]
MANKPVIATTKAKYLHISPRKLRLVANAIKALTPKEALSRLKVWNKKGAPFLQKAINSALADAENNFNLNKEDLRFKEIIVSEGPRLKRMDQSHGARFAQGLKQKRMSHLRVVVEGKKEEK